MKHFLGLPCTGGKARLLPILLSLIKYLADEYSQNAFIDICGGGGKLACNIARGFYYKKVLYNEYERGVAALIACLTNEANTYNVINKVNKLVSLDDPEKIFHLANEERNLQGLDILLAAAYTFFCIYTSRANDRKTFDKSKVNSNLLFTANKLLKYPPNIHNMVVTCGNCLDILERYVKRDDITSFIDPPYYQTSSYKNNWGEDNYKKLVNILSFTHNKVILCGREADGNVYDCLLCKGWYKTSMGFVQSGANHPEKRAEEFIWTNFPVPKFIINKITITG